MIQVTFFKDSKNNYKGFRLEGHAEYADIGEDVVCSAVSALAITACNSIEMLTADSFSLDTDQESGLIALTFQDEPCHDSQILIKSFNLGMQGIANEYGKDYVRILFKEV